MNDEPRARRFAAVREIWESWTAEQRLGVTVFAVCGLFTLGFSGWYVRAQIRAPFLASKTILDTSRQFVAKTNQDLVKEAELKTKDTDGDGLSDWDELNTYHTSPYLADSDSDGLSDGVEITQATDPNCPKDRDCQLKLDGVSAVSATSSIQNLLPGNDGTRPTGASPTAPAPNMSASQIRVFLVSNGLATDAQLKGLSDAALEAMYQQAAQGVQTTPQKANDSGTPAPSANTVPSTP